MKLLLCHSIGQHDLKTVVRSNFREISSSIFGFIPLLLLLLKGGHHRFVVEVQVPHEASAVATEGDQVPSTGFATCLSIVKLVEEEFKQNILIDFGRGHVESSKAIKELIFK